MVRFYNTMIRKELNKSELFSVGEILMGYSNGNIIENGQEYMIQKVEYQNMTIKYGMDYNCIGYLVSVSTGIDKTETMPIFFPDITKKENVSILAKLKQFADKVNSRGSSKRLWCIYCLKIPIILHKKIFITGMEKMLMNLF